MPGTSLPNTPTPVIAYAFGPFRLDLVLRRLVRDGNAITLPSLTFDILKTLVENRGELVTKEQLFKQVWPGRFVEENNLTVRMSELRKVLRDSAETRFIETVPGYGYRFVAKVTEIVDDHGLPDAAFKSVAVLPLINKNNRERLEYVCEGITESLISSLSHIANLRVMSRSTVFRYKRSDVDPRTIGEELRVEIVLVGKVDQESNHLVFELEMIDAKSGWHLWGGKYKRRISDLVTLPDEIVRQVLPNLQVALTATAEKQLSNVYAANEKAYEMYLKGRYFLNQRLTWWTRKATRYFTRAIEEDPGYALAFVGLADTYLQSAMGETDTALEAIPKAKAAVLRALEIDGNLADAHLTKAKILSSYEFDWDGAEREFKLAIQLDPFHAHAHQHYANFLIKFGYFDEALIEINRAFNLDPLSIAINLTMAKIYYFAGKHDLAVKKARELLEIEPRYSAANGLIGFVYLESGQFAEAIEQFKIMHEGLAADPTNAPGTANEASDKTEVTEADPEGLSFLGYTYGIAGERNKALGVLGQLTEMRTRKYVQPHHLAVVYLGLGDDNSAFEWLDQAVVERCAPVTYIKVWPIFDRVRSDPRYEDLLRGLRLPL